MGLLIKDADPAGGFTELARKEGDSSYTVNVTTAEQLNSSYQVGFLSIGQQNRVNIFPDGTRNDMLIGTDSSRHLTYADKTALTAID